MFGDGIRPAVDDFLEAAEGVGELDVLAFALHFILTEVGKASVLDARTGASPA